MLKYVYRISEFKLIACYKQMCVSLLDSFISGNTRNLTVGVTLLGTGKGKVGFLMSVAQKLSGGCKITCMH